MSVVSVVIPTLGRDSLRAALDSARTQQGVDVDIIVVNDSGQPLVGDLGAHVRVIDTPGRTGSAAARNAGLAEVRGDFLAFLDDDDTWLPGHLSTAVDALTAQPDADIYFCRGLVLYGGTSSRVEPAESLGGRTAADWILGRDNWRSRNRRVLTPTIVARGKLASHPMDPTLACGEDTWWLLTAEAAGATVIAGDHVGVIINPDVERDQTRRRDNDQRAFAERLETLRPGSQASYLIARQGRAAARAGDPQQVLYWARAARESRDFATWLPVIGLELGLASVARLKRRVRG